MYWPGVYIDVYHQFIFKNELLFFTGSKPGVYFLKLYGTDGILKWTIETDYLHKILVDTANNIIIGNGYYRLKDNNGFGYFTTAFNLKTGERLWDFPTAKAYNPEIELYHLNIRDLFQVNDKMYAMIVGRDSSPNSYKLIFFDKEGKIFEPINLPDLLLDTNEYFSENKFSVIYLRDNQFEIVNNYRTTRFKIYASQQ